MASMCYFSPFVVIYKQEEADTPVGDIVRIGPIFFQSEIPPPFPLLNVPFEPFFN